MQSNQELIFYFKKLLKYKYIQYLYIDVNILAELAEHSPIIIQNSSNSSSQKKLDVRSYNCMTI